MSRAQVNAFVGIGSNLGNPQRHVEDAMLQMESLPQSRITGKSSLFRTAPLDADGADYINAVIRLETTLTAAELLASLQAIEQTFGRERPYHNAPRTLDLDILLYGARTMQSESLTVPHPRLTSRAFALIPMLQIDPLVTIPGMGMAHTFLPGVAGQKINKI